LRKRKKMEREAWGARSSKEEDDVEGVQLVGVDLRCPPAKLRRGGGLQWWGEKMKLLHGLRLERESGV
jgi:hypothetical protein